jgi:uncharacterized membrane protein
MAEEGRPAAAIVWILYILSIPSAGTLVLVGLVIAYVARGSAHGWVRSHFDQQIRIFWQSFWWHVLPWVALVIAAIVTLGVAALAFFWVPLLINLVLLIWFTVKSVFGLIALMQAKPVP